MSGPRIRVHVDRLVMRGVDAADGRVLANALRAEIARALADPQARAALPASRNTPVLRLGKATLQPGADGARKLGTTIARAIVRPVKP